MMRIQKTFMLPHFPVNDNSYSVLSKIESIKNLKYLDSFYHNVALVYGRQLYSDHLFDRP